jgi:glycosyltransferase involved in cell wall biosynthesis
MSGPTLHVAQIGFFFDPQRREPARLLHEWPSLVDVAEAACLAGVRVTVVQTCAHTQTLERNGVRYHFFPFGRAATTVGTADPFGELLRKAAADVLHVHGLGFAHEVLSLAAIAPGIPIVLQDHASRPPRLWRRRLWRRAFGAASGLSFCSLEQAQPFARAGLIPAKTRVYEIPECPSRFTTGAQAAARRATGLEGDPCLLWVGHLDQNKDPLTVLDGVSEAVRQLPGLQLWCCFATAPLLPMVQRRISSDPRLRHRVHLLGRVQHERIEQLMRAADLFVLGSHREGSGYSLIEALACGLSPAVTDIPSFRSLTGAGAVGALWPCGAADKCAAALVSLAAQPRSAARAAARAQFDKELSFEAVGRKLASVYRDLLQHQAGQYPRSSGCSELHIDHA